MQGLTMFQTTPRLVMGPGALGRIVDELRRLGGGKVLVATDPGIVRIGLADRLEGLLSAGGIDFVRFDAVEPDPSIQTALAAAELAKKENVQAVIGLGGGSALDIAKVAAVLAGNDGPVSGYFGIDLIPRPGLPTILVPTTAGTGSEVTPIAILSDHEEKLKKGIVSPHLFPKTALLDPELTLGLPPQVTAATGMDALIHAVEAYTSKNASSLTDTLAEKAIRLIGDNIRVAYANGSNLAARAAMLEGSLLAGMAFANAGVTAVHAFAYPIGAEFHIPHGVANSIMLVPVMEFNMIGDLAKFAALAHILGEPVSGLNRRQAALSAVEALRDLTRDLRIPASLSSFGVTEADIPELAKGVMKVTRLLANNPRVMTVEDAEAIYRRAL